MQVAAPARHTSQAPPGASGRRCVFISYRHSDSPGTTGRLTDALVQTFGGERVFRDTKAIRAGSNVVTAIEMALKDCAVLLVVIGPGWLARLQSYGSEPSDGPVDYLRWQLKSALTQGIQLIPILVDGATMPVAQDLPDELKPLALLQSLELRDKDWEYGLGQLVPLLTQVLGPNEADSVAPVPTNKRVWVVGVVTALGIAAVVSLGVLYSGLPREPLAGIDTLVPDSVRSLFRDQSADSGVALLVAGAILAMLRALAEKYRDAVAGHFGAWLLDSRVFGVVTGCIVALPLLLVAGRTLLAVTLVAIAGVYLAARGLVPRFFASTTHAGMAGAAALALLAGALGMDIANDNERQTSFDVAFLLPPEGGPDVDASMRVFDDVSRALHTALKDADNVELIPTKLNKDDFSRYVISNSEVLLDKKGRKGYPRVFIRVAYSLDPVNGMKRIGVKPYFRPAGRSKTIGLIDRWNLLPMAGNAESPVVALKASFELIAFLTSEGLLRLDAAQRQQVWRNLLDEFIDSMALTRGDCNVSDSQLAGLRELRDKLDETVLRRVLFKTCAEGMRPPQAADASATAVATATAPYADLVQP